jgi:hydroxyethylthiazole kinase-like uncharacterized protein yjeF
MKALTRLQARALDRIASEEFHIPSILLMENAGIGVARLARRMLRRGAGLVRVFCGPGGNGGDGLAAARHLHSAGIPIRVHLLAPEAAYSGDAGVNLAIVRAIGLELVRGPAPGPAALVIDAIFGIGLARPIAGPMREAVEAVGRCGAPVLAVDIPSGLDADTGLPLGYAVRADVTATMAAPKRGLLVGEGPAHAGRVRVVDLGIPPECLKRALES